MRHTAWVFGAFLLFPSGLLAQTAPPAASDAREATVVALHGPVEAQAPGASAGRAPAAGDVLAAGTRLSASEGATIVLSLPNGAPASSFFSLAAPSWREAPPRELPTLGGARSVSFSYGPSGGVAVRGWRVELARDADFRDLVVSERLPPRQLRWDGTLQGAGDWYARVSAIDALGLDGVPSPAAHITVAAPAIVPGAEATGDSPARPATLRAPAGVFSLRLSDLAGIPIPYANVRVTSDAGVLIDDLREASERGVYVAAIQWRGARARIPLRFTVNDGLTFSHDVATDEASHAAP